MRALCHKTTTQITKKKYRCIHLIAAIGLIEYIVFFKVFVCVCVFTTQLHCIAKPYITR